MGFKVLAISAVVLIAGSCLWLHKRKFRPRQHFEELAADFDVPDVTEQHGNQYAAGAESNNLTAPLV